MEKTKKIVKFKKGFFQDWTEAILWAFVVAMLIRNYTFQNFKIPSGSMEQTLLVGDYLVANKLKYLFNEPQRGEIVTFRNPDDPKYPANCFPIIAPIYWRYEDIKQNNRIVEKGNRFIWYEKKNIVKRIIGMPGDTIYIRDKQIFINDELYITGKEQFLDQRLLPRELSDRRYSFQVEKKGSRDNLGPIEVPDGKYFVLGDNRDYSLDSRYWGFLDRKDITGTPAVIFFSKGDGFLKNFRFNRMFNLIK